MNYRGIDVQITNTPAGWRATLLNGSFVAAGNDNNPIPSISLSIDVLINSINLGSQYDLDEFETRDEAATHLMVEYQVTRDVADAVLNKKFGIARTK